MVYYIYHKYANKFNITEFSYILHGAYLCVLSGSDKRQPPIQWVATGSFPGVKLPGFGVDHPPPSSAEVKERVELYFYCPYEAFLACSFPGVKLPGFGVDHPPPSSAEVKERVELYFYSPYGAFLACSGVKFTFTFYLEKDGDYFPVPQQVIGF